MKWVLFNFSKILTESHWGKKLRNSDLKNIGEVDEGIRRLVC